MSGEKAPEIFRNEIKALLSLNHDNIVKIYEYGVVGRILQSQVETKAE